ncbi:MAG TPA: ABC transporter ATP-binding protein [Pseudolabrys sp.]|nr:ABC transporter ATP-binding protein [Pseudolabrys sp.]
MSGAGMSVGPAHREKVSMRGVAKRFGDVTALRGVDFTVAGGEIHGLLGENGAGKTTLMNVLSGLYRADRAEIAIDGRPVVIRSPADALAHRIGMVHQHVELIASFTALENVLLGREGGRWQLHLDRHRHSVEAVARRFGLAVPLDVPVRTLAAGVQQKIEILKALYRGVEILILDEPTTMLTPQEVDVLFATIRTMTAEGLTVIFITHKIREILANCDRITVMQAGVVAATLDRAAADEAILVEMMIGQRPSGMSIGTPAGARVAGAAPLLEVRELVVEADQVARAVDRCSFALAGGELVGLAGVAGNGQRELAEALVGLLPAAEGSIAVAGSEVTRASVRERLAAGLVHIAEDRIEGGVLPGLSVTENLMLGLHRLAFRGRLYDRRAAGDLARRVVAEYAVVAPHEDMPATSLSGGNIQKLMVARAMMLAEITGGRVVVAANPTRGLDVRATEFVRSRLVDFVQHDGAVLLVSEDLDELLQLCDRILVMYRGRIVGDLPRPEFDAYRIGALMAGTRDEVQACA